MDTRNVQRWSDEMVCMWDHGLQSRRPAADLAYTGIELSSSHDVRARSSVVERASPQTAPLGVLAAADKREI